MKITKKQATLIKDYLEYYYQEHRDCNDQLPFKNQMQLIYDYTNYLLKNK